MSGIFGSVSRSDCFDTVLYGTDYHSHLGTEFGGMAVYNGSFIRQIHNISQSQFKSKFYGESNNLPGKTGIGVISALEEQPMYVKSKHGDFCIVTNGYLDNSDYLAEYLLEKGISFSEVGKNGVNQTELVGKLITTGINLIDGIKRTFDMIDGSCSLLMLKNDCIIAARDRFGYTTLVVGKKDNEYIVTSETTSISNLGYEYYKELEPGEVVSISEKGVKLEMSGSSDCQICAFLWIYTGFPASNYEGINAEIVRERCGRCMAKKDNGMKADLVCGVPDSGMAHGLGYAMESGLPFRRPLVKYTPGYGRSYTPPSQETRDKIARMKLVPIKEIIENNSVVLCEDSIVRGTQLKNFTVKKLWEAKAKEIHVRVACPPLMFPCKFNISTRSIGELAGRKAIKALEGRDLDDVSDYIDSNSEKHIQMVDWIVKDLEVTSIKYQTIEDMVDAIGLPRKKLCLYCWTGESPSKKVYKPAAREQAEAGSNC